MFARLRGKVANKSVDRMILDVGGVGYDIMMSLNTYNQLPENGEEATLHIHTRIREDAFDLVGFADLEEREMFRLLLSVSGIGPRVALNILSGLSPAELVDTLMRENLASLTSISGIGKRTAERLIVELRDKVKDLEYGLNAQEAAQADRLGETLKQLQSALLNMGYKAATVEKVATMLKPEVEDGVELGELVRLALQKMMKTR